MIKYRTSGNGGLWCNTYLANCTCSLQNQIVQLFLCTQEHPFCAKTRLVIQQRYFHQKWNMTLIILNLNLSVCVVFIEVLLLIIYQCCTGSCGQLQHRKRKLKACILGRPSYFHFTSIMFDAKQIRARH